MKLKLFVFIAKDYCCLLLFLSLFALFILFSFLLEGKGSYVALNNLARRSRNDSAGSSAGSAGSAGNFTLHTKKKERRTFKEIHKNKIIHIGKNP